MSSFEFIDVTCDFTQHCIYICVAGQSLRLLFFSHRIKELLLDILDSSTKEKDLLEKAETSFTDVIREQMEGLLTGKGVKNIYQSTMCQ